MADDTTTATTGDTTASTAAAAGSSAAAAGDTSQKAGAGDGAGDKTAADATKAGDAAATAAAAAAGDGKGGDGGDAKTGKDGKTILEGGGSDKQVTTPADWPADWRTKGLEAAGIAADDKKALAMLERLASPGDMVKKLLEQEKLISQGVHKKGLAKDATAEQVAAYRKENGIPESIDKYDLALQDGMVIGESDKPIINSMLTTMLDRNLDNDTVKAILASYYTQEKAFLAEREKAIDTNKTTNDDALHQEWGNEYRPNLNAIGSLVKTFSDETRSSLAGALDSDGFPLLNNKAFLKDMAVMSRTINPIDTVVSSGGGNQMSSVEDEIKQIEGRMGGVDPTYYKDDKAQKRLLQLYEWREGQKPRK